jgi:hypothetical protein
VTHPQQLVHWLRSACLQLTLAVGLSESAWERLPMDIPPTAFGPGSQSPFGLYFEGQSRVAATSIDDIVGWLGSCEYVSDLDQFHEPDFWQQPCAFEQRRRGDCEDFALWTWRKLVEIGIEAEFFVGRVVSANGADEADKVMDRQHAWVVFRSGRDVSLFEPAARDRQLMIQPWAAVKDRYVPHFAVDHRFVTSAFVGCIQDSRRSARPDRGRITIRTDGTSD